MIKTKLTRAEAGRLGAFARHQKSPEELNNINKKIVTTRLKKNPHAFREMVAMGGGRKKSLSASEMAALRNYLLTGKTQKQAANQFKISVSSVFRYSKLYDIESE